MAKTKLVDEEDDLREQAEELAALNQAEGGDLFRAIDEVRSVEGATAVLRRIAPSEKAGYCTTVPIADFSLEYIKRKWGAGKYVVRFRGPKGFIPGGQSVEIAPSEEIPAASGRGEFVTFIEYMEKREAEQRARSSERMNQLATLGIPALTSILTAFITRGSGNGTTELIAALKPPSVTEMITAMSAIQQLNPKPPQVDPIENIGKIMELVQNMPSGGSSGETTWMDLVKELIAQAGPALAPLAQKFAQIQTMRANAGRIAPTQVGAEIPALAPIAVPPPTGAVRAVSTAAPSVPAAVAAENAAPSFVGNADGSLASNGSDKTMWALFKPMVQEKLRVMLTWAQKNKAPDLYAEVLLDELAEIPRIHEILPPSTALEYINRDDWFTQVVSLEPGFKNYERWATDFRTELLLLLNDTGEGEIPAPEPPLDEPQTFVGE